ncbi:MAG: DUF3164 family protein [Desulfovibrio sp.]|nr:DUF3164 family protein [Desulfovibrio sp.]
MQEINGEKYMTNSLGQLLPLDRVEEVDKLRDETVMELVGRARVLSGSLKEEQSRRLDDIAAFISLSGEK